MNKILTIGFLSITLGLLLFGCLDGGRQQVTPTPVGSTATPQPSVLSNLPTISDADLAGLASIEADSNALGDLADDGPSFPEE